MSVRDVVALHACGFFAGFSCAKNGSTPEKTLWATVAIGFFLIGNNVHPAFALSYCAASLCGYYLFLEPQLEETTQVLQF